MPDVQRGGWRMLFWQHLRILYSREQVKELKDEVRRLESSRREGHGGANRAAFAHESLTKYVLDIVIDKWRQMLTIRNQHEYVGLLETAYVQNGKLAYELLFHISFKLLSYFLAPS